MSNIGSDLRSDARARLAAIVEDAYDAILSKSLDGTILSWNRGAERLFGYLAHEVVGRPITLLVPPERVDEEAQVTARIGAGDPLPPFDTERRRKDGLLVAVVLGVSPLRDEHGRIVGTSIIARERNDDTRREYDSAAPFNPLRDANPTMAALLAALEDELRNRLHVVTISAHLLARSSHGDPAADTARELLARQASELPRLIALFTDTAAGLDAPAREPKDERKDSPDKGLSDAVSLV
ncbi:PAS domain S-box-containing protein [Nannocystis exedens]|uniref:histidine kinase n=1 Tax=Nannocystis exedens TaxID=54 RepID=A0A1I2H4L9_9BACT|nr:PAS domain S-box protein [Nannocystis exedens]PCC74034.1 PAS fold protein [Nannocystis exedens]SFF24320.1 PAS domain S-box-containing protein [Nannocystis exedens]